MKNPLAKPPPSWACPRSARQHPTRVPAGEPIVRRDDFANHDEAVLPARILPDMKRWEVMEERLRAQGYGFFSLIRRSAVAIQHHSIPISASIADKIEGICARTGLERFHIIGHSKGASSPGTTCSTTAEIDA